MASLIAMMNIGKELERKLTAVGINSPEKLTELGSKDAFFMLKQRYPKVCLVHLYALEGALQNTEYNRLPEETKQDLKAFNDLLRN